MSADENKIQTRKKIRWIGLFRLLRIFLLLLGITFFSFVLSYLAPGDPAQAMLKQSGMRVSQETLEQMRENMGLNDPLAVQYGRWLIRVLHGDLGRSYKNKKPVASLLAAAIPKTLLLTAASMAFMILISTLTGVLCAKNKGGVFDRLMRLVTGLFSALPSFFAALMILYLLALRLGLFPVIAKSVWPGLVMPVLTLSLTLGAWYVRQIRSMVLGELQKDYVKGLRTRGVSENRILFRHVLKNMLAPLITLLTMSFGSMLGGSAIVESIFAWNGVGKLAVDSISARDYPVIQGYVLWMALIFLVLNALGDLLCRTVDPRIRREQVL